MHAELTNTTVHCTYDLPTVLTVEEAADFLRVNVKTLYRAVGYEAVPALKLGKRIVILRDAMLEWMRSNEHALSSKRRR